MSASESERQLVVFSLNGEHYGLPIGAVLEIIRTTRGAVQSVYGRSS
jgi:chemotaxis signal transduction protein